MGQHLLDSRFCHWLHACWSPVRHIRSEMVLHLFVCSRSRRKHHWSKCTKHRYVNCQYQKLPCQQTALTETRPPTQSTASLLPVSSRFTLSLVSLYQTPSEVQSMLLCFSLRFRLPSLALQLLDHYTKPQLSSGDGAIS